mmetsp:Transcript_29295/g.85167  ORF Transcript_29295/g.85167 Transcript_29295/m.85167 type:complete len:208 (-) Transcript_29295:188-811(-)
MAEFILNYLPLIDEHNRQRQNILALEKSWPTKCCWFRLLTTVVGMSVVDEFYYYKYKDKNTYDFGVGEFSNRIAKGIRKRDRREDHNADPNDKCLTPIVDEDGFHYRDATEGERRRGKTHVALHDSCWICKKYATGCKGTDRYNQTVWCCKDCGTPICRVDRRSPTSGRNMTCVDEHVCGSDPAARCEGAGHKKSGHYPTKRRKVGL